MNFSLTEHFLLGILFYFFAFLILKYGVGDARLKGGGVVTMTFLCMSLLNLPGSLTLLFTPDKYKAIPFWWANILCILFIVLGALFVSIVTKQRKNEFKNFIFDCRYSTPSLRERRFIVGFGLVCIGVFFLYLTQVRSWPFLHLFKGTDHYTLLQMRISSFGPKMNSPFWYIFGIFRTFFMPLMFLLIILFWKNFKTSQKVISLVVLAVIFLYQSWSSAKTPIAMLFLLLLFAFLMNTSAFLSLKKRLFKDKVKRTLVILAILFVALGYPTLVYSLKTFGQNQSLYYVLVEGVFHRIFYVPIEGSYLAFTIFPERVDFTHFRDISKLATVMGWEPINLSELVAILVYGFAFNSPPSTIGNFWAQGGWTVVVLGSFVAGITLQGIQVSLIRMIRRDTVGLALILYLYYSAYRLCMTSFHGMLMSEGVLLVLLFAVVWKFLFRFSLKPTQKN